MTTLADAINMPLVAVWGLATLGPLTLVVTAIESLVFRRLLAAKFSTIFVRILAANLLSMLAGGLLLMFQDLLVGASGIDESIPAFVRGYHWMGPLLIALYFAKSIAVEGVYLTRRGFLERVGLPKGGTFKAVLIGNCLTYLIVGPLFYYTTRPGFAGLETTYDTAWTSNPDVVMYYIDQEDEFVKRVRLNGQDAETMIPHPVWSFLVSADESTFAYVTPEKQLCAYKKGTDKPILVSGPAEERFMTFVSLSPDCTRLAFLQPPEDGSWSYSQNAPATLHIFSLGDRSTVEVGTVRAHDWRSRVSWSADGATIYVLVKDVVHAFNPEPPYGLRETSESAPPDSGLVVTYLRAYGNAVYSGGRPMIKLPRQCEAGPYQATVWPYLESSLHVDHNGKPLLDLKNEYGLLNLSLPPLKAAVFLPSEDELVLEWWGQSYLLGLKSRKIGLAARGDQFVLRTPGFRISLSSKESHW